MNNESCLVGHRSGYKVNTKINEQNPPPPTHPPQKERKLVIMENFLIRRLY